MLTFSGRWLACPDQSHAHKRLASGQKVTRGSLFDILTNVTNHIRKKDILLRRLFRTDRGRTTLQGACMAWQCCLLPLVLTTVPPSGYDSRATGHRNVLSRQDGEICRYKTLKGQLTNVWPNVSNAASASHTKCSICMNLDTMLSFHFPQEWFLFIVLSPKKYSGVFVEIKLKKKHSCN